MSKKTKTSAAKAPTSVLERRQAMRASQAGPGVKKITIDLTKPGARKALTALFPAPTSERYIDATPETEAAAFEYITARAAATAATTKKEVAGNTLCNEIGLNKGIRGKGWKAEWDMSKGNVDWAQLAKDLAIPDATIAKYRKPDVRGLDVTEVDEE